MSAGTEMDMVEVFYEVIEQIGHKEWKEFCRKHLRPALNESDMDTIEAENPKMIKDGKFEMLRKWKQPIVDDSKAAACLIEKFNLFFRRPISTPLKRTIPSTPSVGLGQQPGIRQEHNSRVAQVTETDASQESGKIFCFACSVSKVPVHTNLRLTASDITVAVVPNTIPTFIPSYQYVTLISEIQGSSGNPRNKHIFISYCWRDAFCLAEELEENLKCKTYDVWRDKAKVYGNILKSVAKGLENAWLVLLIISPNYADRNFCTAEAEDALKNGQRIIPIRIKNDEDYEPPHWLQIIERNSFRHYFVDGFSKEKFDDLLNDIDQQYRDEFPDSIIDEAQQGNDATRSSS